MKRLALICVLALAFPTMAQAHTTGSHRGYRHVHTCWHSSHRTKGRNTFYHHHRGGCNGYTHNAPASAGVRGSLAPVGLIFGAGWLVSLGWAWRLRRS